MTEFQSVIGMEVHAQLKTNTKLFCGCSTSFGDSPNSNVCPVCLGMPGALPVLNKRAVELAIQAGLALGCTINHKSVFARKNYFYPDLPKGYQISQYDLPICSDGSLTIETSQGPKTIGITRIHMEEDAGKLLHQGADAIYGSDYSLVDLNRACTPLIEIVSEPDIRTPEEARVYVETLKLIIEHIGVCDGNLEEGSLRADANISIMPVGSDTFGTRTEVKNINSFKSIERAIISEIKRQKELVLSGGQVEQQTRNYDDNTQKTTVLRSKEDAHDYRYFPEPDLPPLIVTDAQISAQKDQLKELPQDRSKRYQDQLDVPQKDAQVLIHNIPMMTYFEDCLALGSKIAPKTIAKWVITDLTGQLNTLKITYADTKLTPAYLIELLDQLNQDKISGKIAKNVMTKVIETGKSPKAIIDQEGLAQISDTGAIETAVDQVLAANPDVVEKIKNGKQGAIGFLVGQVMKETRGQAKPNVVTEIINKKLA